MPRMDDTHVAQLLAALFLGAERLLQLVLVDQSGLDEHFAELDRHALPQLPAGIIRLCGNGLPNIFFPWCE